MFSIKLIFLSIFLDAWEQGFEKKKHIFLGDCFLYKNHPNVILCVIEIQEHYIETLVFHLINGVFKVVGKYLVSQKSEFGDPVFLVDSKERDFSWCTKAKLAEIPDFLEKYRYDSILFLEFEYGREIRKMINKGLKVFFFIFSIFTGKQFEKN